MTRVAALALVLGLIFINFTAQCYGQLRVGFYDGECFLGQSVESIVRRVVTERFDGDPTIVAALLRLQFHDCFVNGCDASLLLDGKDSEKTARPNLSVRGYDIIDEAKTALRFFCPQAAVSCSDIIAMATRDAVSLAKGGWYDVETGRRDGPQTSAKDVNLPSTDFNVSQAVAAFRDRNLSPTDMVYLLGAHTVGVAHCSFFEDRLYNFQNGGPDGTMNETLRKVLQDTCPRGRKSLNTAILDQNPTSAFIVDKSYYQQIQNHFGILRIDQLLALDPITQSTVANIVSSDDFSTKFGEAMVKLGRVGVLTGEEGEIRNSCRAVNTFRRANRD
ncbi:hypothetical protein K2173_014261 [Erythroxylum novogranatense]|uniref:Peroxidase n=1 Tax=Erythroxylum novogranatense TaxID=1862640 RepID=A0AAV8SEA7_9ROSI|nr:hypothetical protein K2173_014261 [Erythroxylum novogranatense]